jgi:hypothetical protein
VIEGLVAADASGESPKPDDAERQCGDTGRKNAAAGMRQHLRCGNERKLIDQRKRKARPCHSDRGGGHPAALGPAAVDQGAGRCLRQDTRQHRQRHHRADPGLVPLPFGQEIDGEIRAKAVAHVSEKEIQRIQLAPNAFFSLPQARLSLLMLSNGGRCCGFRKFSLQDRTG